MKTALKQDPQRLEMSKAAKEAGFSGNFLGKVRRSSWVDFSNDDLLEEAFKIGREKTRKFLGLLAEGCEENRTVAAGCWETPPESLKKLARDSSKEIRGLVAGNPSSPDEALRILASDMDTDVMNQVVQNLNAGEGTLDRVLNCPICRKDEEDNYGIFSSIGQHPNATTAMREKLASSKCDLIRGAVASNPMTEEYILERLIEKNGFEVSENPGASAAILEKVFPRAMRELKTKDNPTMLCNLARNPNCTADLLDELARVGQGVVALEVAGHPHTFPWGLDFLAKNYGDAEVLSAVIRNPRVSDETLLFLYHRGGRCPSEAVLSQILLRKAEKRNCAILRKALIPKK